MVCKVDMSRSFQSSFLGLCVGHSELATCLSVPCLCPKTAWLGSSTPEAMNAGDAVMEYITAVRLKMTEPHVSRKICCSYFTCFESKCDFKEAQKWCVDVHPKSSKLLLQASGNQTWKEVFKQLTSFFWYLKTVVNNFNVSSAIKMCTGHENKHQSLPFMRLNHQN